MNDTQIKQLELLAATGLNSVPDGPARIVNGRGGHAPGFGGMNIDIYPPLIFITLYSEYSDGDISGIAAAVKKAAGEHPLLVQDRSLRPFRTRLKEGEIPDELIVEENGLRFYLNPLRGQNPGFFADMREGRKWLLENTPKGGRVLNLFSYTCALSVAALAAGASKVVNIDKNSRSLDIGKRNHRLNHGAVPGGYTHQAVFLPHDIFKSIGRLKKDGPYDLIIADPPPSQKGSFLLEKDYPRLLRRLSEMLAPGGHLMLSLNSPARSWDDFETMIRENLPGYNLKEKIQPPEDFAPLEDGRGLKIFIVGMPD